MSVISKEQAKEFVKTALKTVADFNSDDIEEFSFSSFTPMHMKLFLNKLVSVVNENGYDVTLNYEIADEWKTIKDCIEYIKEDATLIIGFNKL